MKYLKQLDVLRAVAVILVIIHHWIPPVSLSNKLQLGAIGVDIFFVLSGFLITRILFQYRIESDLSGMNKKSVLKIFYIRRTLRIFPIYYLVILILLFFNKYTGTNIASAFPFFLTYTSNFYFFKIQAWDGMISHLWSLAVEEQFYLIWPLLILFINKKYYLPVIVSFILIGVLSQYYLRNIDMSNYLTFTCFDAFGIGALLAWKLTFNNENLNLFYKRLNFLFITALFIFIIGIKTNLDFFVPFRLLHSIIALWVISSIIIKQDSIFFNNALFNNKILISIGKISYGLYLYHNFIPKLNSIFINTYINPLLPKKFLEENLKLLILIENITLLLIISWLSYIFIEKYFLNLKKHFVYTKEVGLSIIRT